MPIKGVVVSLSLDRSLVNNSDVVADDERIRPLDLMPLEQAK